MRFWSEKSFCFSTKRLRVLACWFSFTLRWNDRVKIKLRSDAFLKFLFKLRLKREKRETNLMQACSANQHQVIMPSWLPKVPSWLRKNALCFSQSAFSNFALHVINCEKSHSWFYDVKKLLQKYVVTNLSLMQKHTRYLMIQSWYLKTAQLIVSK